MAPAQTPDGGREGGEEATAAAPSALAANQYAATSARLATRLAIHDYNTHGQGWFAWVGDRLDKAAAGAGACVLEVGAGTGELWRQTAPPAAGGRLVLSDFSPAMCAALREVAASLLQQQQTPAAGAAGSAAAVPGLQVEVVQASATALPFPDGAFDVVVANHMLYHVDDPDAALAELARVLRPGGQAAVALNGADHLAELLGVGAAVGRANPMRSRAKISAANAADFLARHFVAVEAELFPGAFSLPAAGPVLDYVGSMGDEGLSAEQEETGRKIVEARIAAEGEFRVTKHMVLFRARKA